MYTNYLVFSIYMPFIFTYTFYVLRYFKIDKDACNDMAYYIAF